MLTLDLDMALRNAVGLRTSEDLYLLADDNSRKYCLQEITKTLTLKEEHILCIPAGEEHKTLQTVERIWA